MKGLELAEKYFEAYGRPLIRKFADYSDQIAAGLVGDGSECFGFDDRISQDHDWGPGFCLWLNEADYQTIGADLEKAFLSLPTSFLGYGPRMTSQWGFSRIGVFSIPGFYQVYTGLDHLPQGLEEWLYLPENNLAACTNGRVFYDPKGEFSRWRETFLGFYPEDIRLKKIASRCMTLAQFGQYNFRRCVKRKEFFSARYAETKFCADAVSMTFLLNKRYAPFFKWMHRALADLPIMGRWLQEKIQQMVETGDYEEKADLIEQISGRFVSELRSQNLSESNSLFLLDHGPQVQQKIKDKDLRNRNVWLG
jgi:hypothetical protein